MADVGSTDQRRRVASIVRLTAYLLAGPLIWAVQFSIVYALHALACATSSQQVALGGWLLLSMMIVTMASVAAALAVLALGRRIRRAICNSSSSNEPGRNAYGIISNLLIILSIVAISWSGLTIALLEVCNRTQI